MAAILGRRAAGVHCRRPAPGPAPSACRAPREVDVDLAQPARHRARRAVADRVSVDAHHRLHEGRGAGDEGLAGRQGLGHRERALLDAHVTLGGQRQHREPRAAGQDRVRIGARDQRAVDRHDEGGR